MLVGPPQAFRGLWGEMAGLGGHLNAWGRGQVVKSLESLAI